MKSWQRDHWHGVAFLPQPMADTLSALLKETGNVEIRLGTTFTNVSSNNGRVTCATLSDGSTIRARIWVDACNGNVCRALGCKTFHGADPKSRYGEPSAPENASDHQNGATLIYTIQPGFPAEAEPLPDGIPLHCWWSPHFPAMHCVQAPDQRRNCNMLPTMEGRETSRLRADAAYAECRRRVKAHWHFVQTHWPEFRTYRIIAIAPRLGMREGQRVACEKMLTENDIRRGLRRQAEPDIIAIADHALDRHGEGGGCRELEAPYGIPLRCLIPRGWINLLVAGRAAGFSSIAASSCRLTRTMMQIGQAAGTTAALAVFGDGSIPRVSPDVLRQALAQQHVQFGWPMEAELARHLADEDPQPRAATRNRNATGRPDISFKARARLNIDIKSVFR